MTIPVMIWPSVQTLVVWWLAITGGLIWVRWQEALAHAASIWDVLPQLREDLPYLFQLVLLGVLVLVPVRAIGWLTMLLDSDSDDR